jgi:hypothetical protein
LGRRLDGRAPTIDNSTNATMVLQFKNCSIWSELQRIDGAATSRCYHPTREQGALIGIALYKHHDYTRLGYFA